MPYPSNTVIAAMTPYMSNLGAAVYRPHDNAPASNRSAATSGSDDQPDTTTYGGRHARVCGQQRVTTITKPATKETTASTRRAVRKVSTSRADHQATSSASGGVSGNRYRVRWFVIGTRTKNETTNQISRSRTTEEFRFRIAAAKTSGARSVHGKHMTTASPRSLASCGRPAYRRSQSCQ